jgi:pimeloyl-ACP methyl ester carboxylesterase
MAGADTQHRTPGTYRHPVPAREKIATSADGARLHVEVHGREQDPAVVLAHGWTCRTHFWAPVIRELTATGHRVIVYDQRGHGRTAPADLRGYSADLLADDLCAVLDTALAPGEQAVLGGHSMGAMTLIAAAGRPQLEQRAAALALCSTGAQRLLPGARVVSLRSESARTRAHRFLVTSRLPLGPVTPLTRKALKYGTLGPDATADQVAVVARIVHDCPPRVRGAWGSVLAGLDIHSRVSRLRQPTAVVVGTHDRLTPPALAHHLVDALPHCTGLHELPRLGHMTPVESPGEVAGVLRDLVRKYLAPEAESPGARGSESAPHAAGDAPHAANKEEAP